ncbi:M24 family metallopeptidase [Caulobacter segnis]
MAPRPVRAGGGCVGPGPGRAVPAVQRPGRGAALSLKAIDATPVIDGCRGVKSEAELALMRYAKAITPGRPSPGRGDPGGEASAASAVKRFIDMAHRAARPTAARPSARRKFGLATAYPHGLPGDPDPGEGDPVLIDTGCQVEGYNADITRTYVFGEPGDEHRRIWDIEHEAQAAALRRRAGRARPARSSTRPPARCWSAMAWAPDYALPGLPHRTGHGIGLSIHEGPYLVRGDRTPLAPGMCFSSEPMIVKLPDRFGVRLEDHFHVTEDGAAWFTQPSPSIDAVVRRGRDRAPVARSREIT